MVFRPIAPTNTTMVRNTTASFLDIYASGDGKHPETLYPLLKGCQVARATDLYRIGTHQPSLPFRWAFAHLKEGPSG
jgi:hypothetical protein